MIKQINLIIIGIGITLSTLYNFGYIFIIPILLFYFQKDFKTIFYLFPSTIITSLIFTKDNIITTIILEVILIIAIYLIKNLKQPLKIKYIITSLLLIILNILVYVFLDLKLDLFFYVLYILISLSIYLFLCFEEYLYLNNIVKKPLIYTDHIIIIITVLGACKQTLFSLQLGLILGAYFVIYYSRVYHNIYSLLLGVIIFMIEYLGFNQNEALLILLLCTFYYFDYNYLFFLINIIFMILSFTSDIFKKEYLYVLMFITIIFEFIWLLLIKKQNLKEISKEYIYNLKLSTIENEYQIFTGFLEYYINTFRNNKDYSLQLSKAISCITERHCNNCNKQNECFKNNKTNIVYDFKKLIEQKQPSKDFKQNCTSYQELTKTTDMLSAQITKIVDPTNMILISVLNKTKQVLERHQEDIKNKKLIEIEELINFHTKLYESTYNIKDIRYEKIYQNDLLIEVITNKKEISNQTDFITLLQNAIKYLTKVIITTNQTEDIYTIVLKEKFHIKYGYGNFSSKQNELCGDNYLIKNYDNAHFLAAISDGMGKGYIAFEDSKRVLDALENLGYCSTSIGTNIEILNLLYILQGYTERYSTIDAVDINRTNYMATIYKLGATSSYIFHEDNTYSKITNKGLPLGIEEEVYKEEITLRNNDLIILSSDGIFENVEKEKQLLELITRLKTENPQKIVYEILEYTLKNKVKVRDDMSLIILKVEEIT